MTCNCLSVALALEIPGDVPPVLLTPPESFSGEVHIRPTEIDACLASTIRALWSAGFVTYFCCCGHNLETPYIEVPSRYCSDDIMCIRAIVSRDCSEFVEITQWDR